MRIVSFTGPKSSGKDTSADILEAEKIAKGRISFAGPLKKICAQVFGLHHTLLNDPILKEKQLAEPITLTAKHFRKINEAMAEILDQDDFFYNPFKASVSGLEGTQINTPRELLQVIGTDYIRNRIHADWHLQAAFSKNTLAKLDQDGLYCVTDARFPNEYQFLADKFQDDFKGFYVERPEAEEKLAESTHASELKVKEVRELIPEANIIKNDKKLEDLKKTLLGLKLGESKLKSLGRNKKQEAASKFKFAPAGKGDEGAF
jgi:hypothetical protein